MSQTKVSGTNLNQNYIDSNIQLNQVTQEKNDLELALLTVSE